MEDTEKAIATSTEKNICKSKLKCSIGFALGGALVGYLIARRSDDSVYKLFSTITLSLLAYEVGNIVGDCYHLCKMK